MKTLTKTQTSIFIGFGDFDREEEVVAEEGDFVTTEMDPESVKTALKSGA